MNFADQILGFVDFQGEKFPFSYENGFLDLLPPTEQRWKDLIVDTIKQINNKTKIKNEWINNINLLGKTNNGRNILFKVPENYSSNNGFIKFEVFFFVTYENNIDLNEVSGMIITGSEIDYYFPLSEVFNSQILYSQNTNKIESFSSKCDGSITKNCGSYRYKDVDVKINTEMIPTIRPNSDLPLTAKNEMVLSFDKPSNFETVIDCYFDITSFFRYICYRKNIYFDTIQLFSLQDGKRNRFGDLVFMPQNLYEKETNKSKSSCIIKGKFLGEKASLLISQIAESKIYLEHLCDSIDSTGQYQTYRQILLFCAFEREFRNIYGDNYKRSEDYLQVKNEILHLISKFSDKQEGKKRKYSKGIHAIISKIDHSLAEKIKAAITDCQDIMNLFINFFYKSSDFEKIITEVSNRMNIVRNSLTHAALGNELEAIQLYDFHTIEILLYAMRLKYMGLESKIIQQSIADLFQIHIRLT